MHDVAFPIIAAVLATCHIVSPAVFRRRVDKDDAALTSFSGGLAVAYVFLFLLPELDDKNIVVGERIYVIALVGFILTYIAEHWISRRRAMDRHRATHALHNGFAVTYTFLIVYTLGNQLPDTIPLVIVFTVSLGLHLISGHIASIERFGADHLNRDRFLLAAAALAGYGLTRVQEPDELVVDILSAILAGFILFNVFREELPKIGKVRLWPFLMGIALFALLHVALHMGRDAKRVEEGRVRVAPVSSARSAQRSPPPLPHAATAPARPGASR